MNSLDMSKTIAELTSLNPGYSKVLQKFYIDPQFAANLTLTEVCAMHGLSLQELLNQMATCDRELRFLSDKILEGYDIPQLIGYILFTHHAYLDKELPRMAELLGEAIERDGPDHPDLLDLLTPFKQFKESLEWHLREEERNLFPFFLLLVAPQKSPALDQESVETLTQLFKSEEAEIDLDLERLRQKTRGYHVPEGASQAYRTFFYDLSLMEFELRRHMFVENRILFPKVLARERELMGRESDRFSLSGK